MKKKRVLSGIVMICLLLSTICIPAFGTEVDSKGLEQAIVATKKIITIPDSYNDFTHSSSEVEINGGKVTVWELNWSEKEGKNGSISVSIDENGNLYEYGNYSGDESFTGLAKITKEEAQKSAEEFLEKAITTDVGEMKIIDKNSNTYRSEEYNFNYEKFVNDVPVNFCSANICVNKDTGEVTSFNKSNTDSNKFEYPSLEGTIESSVAEKDYIDKVGVDLKYYSHYDYNSKKMNVFAGYSVNDNQYKAIDGKTGQVITISNEDEIDGKYNVGSTADETVATSNSPELTEEESDAVDNVDGLISKEKAESIIKESAIINSEVKVTDVSLNKNDRSQKYVWDIDFEDGYGKVDAQSGELLSAHFYNDSIKGNINMSKSEAKNVAENFLKKIASNKLAQTKYDEQNETDSEISAQEEESISAFNFARQVNGIEFASNSLRVEVDKTNGKVIGYDNKWYDNVTFPDISGVMNKELAFNKIKEYKGFILQYNMSDNNKAQLVYNFNDLSDNYIIDPITGVRLDYTGQIYKENKLPEYTDISGHWCEKIVKELLDNGYYIAGEKFNPNMNITQINFFKYIYSSMNNDYTDDEFYNMLVENGVIKKEEEAPNSFVSNQDAAKFIIRYLGHDKIATHPEIFNNPFKDNVEDQYKGYAAMCYALNIIKGDTNGNFNGTQNISNAEAAVIVYNLIKNNTR